MRRTAITTAVLCGLVCACARDQRTAPEAPRTTPGPPSPAKATTITGEIATPATPVTPAAPVTPVTPPVSVRLAGPTPAEQSPGKPDETGRNEQHQKKAALAKLAGTLGGKGTAAGAGGLGLRGAGAGGGGIASGIGHGSGSARGSIGVGASGTIGRGSYGAGARSASVMSGPVVARGVPSASGEEDGDGEEATSIRSRDHGVNPFTLAAEDRLSTFAADVDTASYAIARRQILAGTLPSPESVRVEELVNYFRYSYAPPPPDRPLEAHLDAAPSPFEPGRVLLRVGVQARQLTRSERKPLHLTFLVDVSGSMQSPDRLPLAKRALRILVDSLRDGDTVALCTYAGAVRDVLPPTGMESKARIHSAIEDLQAGGSTAMASGLDLAYRNAMKTLDGKSTSRVLVLTDGDANVGASSPEEMLAQIQSHVREGVTLTTVGFGMGNLRDDLLEKLANKGNGNYYYVDSLMQARRVFHEQMGSTLELIAQDVKLQVELDPRKVKRYRLVGYENRAVADRDFRNDRVDAGEVGSGHTVTALYELELEPGASADLAGLATVRIRAKKPRGERAEEWSFPFRAAALAPSFETASGDFRFAVAVMAAAEKLRQSPHARSWDLNKILRIARDAAPADSAERQELVALLERARTVLGALATK